MHGCTLFARICKVLSVYTLDDKLVGCTVISSPDCHCRSNIRNSSRRAFGNRISTGKTGPPNQTKGFMSNTPIPKTWNTYSRSVSLCSDFLTNIFGQVPKDFCSKSGIANKVEFTGKVPFSQIPQNLDASDFFRLVSTAETQSLVTLEALAAGLPAVALEASCTRDILKHDYQGFLVPNNPRRWRWWCLLAD